MVGEIGGDYVPWKDYYNQRLAHEYPVRHKRMDKRKKSVSYQYFYKHFRCNPAQRRWLVLIRDSPFQPKEWTIVFFLNLFVL